MDSFLVHGLVMSRRSFIGWFISDDETKDDRRNVIWVVLVGLRLFVSLADVILRERDGESSKRHRERHMYLKEWSHFIN